MDEQLAAEAASLAELEAAAGAAGLVAAAEDDEEDETKFDLPGFVKVRAGRQAMPMFEKAIWILCRVGKWGTRRRP